MEVATNERHREVQVWLEQVFAGEAIPQYELNARTIDTLHQLMQVNQCKNRDALLIIDDFRQKNEEYKVEGQRLGRVLGDLGLVPTSLSQFGLRSLRTLAGLALQLQVKQSSDSCFLLALENLHHETASIEDSLRAEERSYQHLIRKTKSALLKHSALSKAYRQLEEQAVVERPQVERHGQQANFLQNKCREYKRQVQTLQETLAHAGSEESLYHSVLVKKNEELSELAGRIGSLQGKLQTYHDLPPDLPQTKVKIEALKLEVANLEEELSQKINATHM